MKLLIVFLLSIIRKLLLAVCSWVLVFLLLFHHSLTFVSLQDWNVRVFTDKPKLGTAKINHWSNQRKRDFYILLRKRKCCVAAVTGQKCQPYFAMKVLTWEILCHRKWKFASCPEIMEYSFLLCSSWFSAMTHFLFDLCPNDMCWYCQAGSLLHVQRGFVVDLVLMRLL